MPAESRVWIYLCNRPLNEAEVNAVQGEINKFTSGWKAHQKPLAAKGTILFDQYVVLAVNESFEAISGCSIDSSVHFMKRIGSHLNVDFFNRLNVLIEENDAQEMIGYHDLEDHKGAFVFNPRIENLQELRENWLHEINDAPYF